MVVMPREDSDTRDLMQLYVKDAFARLPENERPIDGYDRNLVGSIPQWLVGAPADSDWRNSARTLDWKATALMVVIAKVFDAHAAELNESTRERLAKLWELIRATPAWRLDLRYRVSTTS
jgi:hypothetical protein